MNDVTHNGPDPAEYEDIESGELVRAKGIIDGATTLAEAARMAHEFGDYLQRLHNEGNVLDHEVEDDYAFYSKP
jgi:hypothetical protein